MGAEYPKRGRAWALGAIDQGVSSATNLAASIVAVRWLEAREIGAFGVAFATYTIVLGVARSVASEPLAIRFAAADKLTISQQARSACGSGLLIALLASIGCLGLALLFEDPMQSSLSSLAIVLPGLIVQDCWRLSFFTRQEGGKAVANDAIWGLSFILIVVLKGDASSGGAVITLWGVAAYVAAVLGSRQAGALPALHRGASWIKSHSDVVPRYVGESLATFGSTQGIYYLVALISGLGQAGILRTGQVLVGPLNVALMGARLVAVPIAATVAAESLDRLFTTLRKLAATLTLVAVAWGALILIVPDDTGIRIIGSIWDDAKDTVLPLSIWLAAFGVLLSPAVGMRVLNFNVLSFRLRILTGMAALGASAVGTAAGGAVGASWGLATAMVLASGMWWILFVVKARRLDVSAGTDAGADVPSTVASPE